MGNGIMVNAWPISAELTAIAQLIFAASTIGLARFYGFTLMFPLFAWIDLQGMPRIALSLGVSLPTVVLAHTVLRETGMPTTSIWVLLVVKELAVGSVLGVILGAPFWAIQGAGDALDVYRGGSAANLLDPVHAQQTTISGTFLGLLTLTLFVTLDGISQVTDLLLRSHTVWPLMSLAPPFELIRLKTLAGVGASGMVLALIVAAPLFTTMFLIDVTLMFAVRGARSFHIYELSQAGRGLMLLMVLPVFVILFADHFSGHSRTFLAAVRDSLDQLTR